MAKPRSGVPTQLKQTLVDEAGGKCANPGCTARRSHIHHIEQWAVYETHDGSQMVALCPTCHDAVHHGPLPIMDETVRQWKAIRRGKPARRSDHIYVEPGDSSKLLLGSIAITGQDGVTVFDLGDSHKLSFRVQGTDVMLVNLAVSTTQGEDLLRVVDGHLRHAAEEPVRYERVPGHIRLTAPASEQYMCDWALAQMRVEEPDFVEDGRLALLDLEVLEPGLLRVQGIWNGDPCDPFVVAITATRLAFLRRDLKRPISLMGEGPDTVLYWNGPISTAIFQGGSSSSVRRAPHVASKPKLGRNDLCWCGSGRKSKKCHGE